MVLRSFCRLLACPLLVLLLALGACSDDDPESTMLGSQVVVGLAPSGQAAAGVKVVAMDPVTNLPAGMPQASGADGLCTFADVPEGVYRLVAFGGPGRFVVSCDEVLQVGAKAGGNALLTPAGADKTSPALPAAKILMGRLAAPGGLPRFSGQVVDDETGEPLAAAFVSTSPFLSGYTGGTTYKDDVTLADGRFLVSEILVTTDQVSGNLRQVEPLLVTCAGYRPKRYVHDFPNGDQNLDISGVTIRLEKVQAQDTGYLSGRLLLLGQPAQGVLVGLGATTGDKSGVGLPGFTAVTDQDGRYVFTDLPRGVYFVHPGFRPGDGFLYLGQAGTVGQTVAPDQQTASPDLLVIHEIDLTYPPNGGVFIDTQTLGGFMWSAVPEALGYTVYLDRGLVGTTDETFIDFPEDMILTAGSHVWSVQAHIDPDLIIGATQTQGLFYIAETAAK